MAYSLVYPNTFCLKLKIHCKICEKKLKNMLLKIQGVHSVKIDENLGNLVISGTVDPATIITMLEKLGRKAELLWQQGHPIKDSQVYKTSSIHAEFKEGSHPNGDGHTINDSNNVQIITQSKVINQLNDPDIMTQLEQLSRIPGLQTIEVTKTIKLSFQGESRNELPGDAKILEISTTKNINGSHDHHSHGGGFCSASSSCCGGHAAISRGGSCHGGNTSFALCCGNRRNCCCSHCLPSQMENWGGASIPSAPPLPSDYFDAAPSPQSSSSSSMPTTYYSVLSDENVNGCIVL